VPILSNLGAKEREYRMAGDQHGRYYAQELAVDQNANIREQIQSALDEGDRHEWHLVGVSDVMAEHVILFWDTERPSYGISHRQ
jgi:hypothetical protein